jgi:microcystin-dependent protein
VFGNTSWQKVPMGISYASGVPAGSMMMWPKSAPPAGWLVRDGSAVSRTTYSSLFAVIGEDYGTGDGSTTFNLPDDRGLTQVGYKALDSAFGTFGASVGSKDAIVVSHNHTTTVTDPGHSHTVNNTRPPEGYAAGDNVNISLGSASTATSSTSTTGISVAVASAGASGTDKNVQPSRVYLPIIKY